MTHAHVAAQLDEVRAAVADACRAAGRDPVEVTLVAVSKGHPPEAIRAAYAAGQRDFGESYVLELRDKLDVLADLPDLRWHFIGHLQRNKMKLVAGRVGLIHAIADESGARALDAAAAAASSPQPILLQVNVGADPAKFGCTADALPALVATVEGLSHLALRGLMTIPPLDIDPAPLFGQLAALGRSLPGTCWLSMGMSDDFPAAIAAGATHVRIGTAIFGARETRSWRA